MNKLKITNGYCQLQPESQNPYRLLQNINLQIRHREITAFLQLQGTGAMVMMDELHRNKEMNPGTIQYVVPSRILPEEKELCVIHYLIKKQYDHFGLDAFVYKALYEKKLRKAFYELHSGLENFSQKKIRELSPDEALLLTVLPALLKHPHILLLDCITTCIPEGLLNGLLKSLSSLVALTETSLLFSTRSPQLAFYFSDRIFIFDHEKMIREIENSERHPSILTELFQMYEAHRYTPAISPEAVKLLNDQQI